jgi:NAD(P)H-hydrate epimerase
LLPCPETEAGSLSQGAVSVILKEAENADILAIGPGISTEEETKEAVLEIIRETYLPLVVDADGLNIAAQDLETVTRRSSLCVMTPHPGEFARLDGKKPAPDEEGRLKAAKRLAGNTRSIVLLKGRGTVVTDGEAHVVVKTGNPGMATAGSGDVLTGMIAALLAVMPKALEGVALAAHLHGLAGDLAAAAVGEVSLTANDILQYLPQAIQQHQQGGAS